jgi:hypothetical protein
MKRYRFAFVVGLLAWCAIGGQAAAAPPDCETARCAAQSALAECPCDLGVPGGTAAATNHGQYVSCVAHAVNALAKGKSIPNNCKGKIRRCAARSTCGKPGAVVCLIPQLGTCDTTAGTCVENSMLLCTTDADCVLGTRCKIKRSADLCEAKGGSVNTAATSCCADCAATP